MNSHDSFGQNTAEANDSLRPDPAFGGSSVITELGPQWLHPSGITLSTEHSAGWRPFVPKRRSVRQSTRPLPPKSGGREHPRELESPRQTSRVGDRMGALSSIPHGRRPRCPVLAIESDSSPRR